MKLSVVLSGIVLATGILTTAVAAECMRPSAPAVPDGATATEEEMIKGQQDVRAFVASTEEFLACIEKQEKEQAKALKKEKKELSVEDRQNYAMRHNAAVDDMEAVAERFNEAVRNYRAAMEANAETQ